MASDINVERIASEEREYKLAVHAISAIRSIIEAAIQAIDDHSKSPAVAAMLQQANEKKP